MLTWKTVSPLGTYFCCLEVRVTCYSFKINIYENVMHVLSFVIVILVMIQDDFDYALNGCLVMTYYGISNDL